MPWGKTSTGARESNYWMHIIGLWQVIAKKRTISFRASSERPHATTNLQTVGYSKAGFKPGFIHKRPLSKLPAQLDKDPNVALRGEARFLPLRPGLPSTPQIARLVSVECTSRRANPH
eukprot:3720577-Amphidinium_carterae.1